jgi:2,4-dienoyl-CoA reductase-like NADH-dependent reductase (Old Yellow Enzyme family)
MNGLLYCFIRSFDLRCILFELNDSPFGFAMTMSRLFTPLTIKSVTLKNRIVISPMCQYSAQDGFANDWHLVHLGSRAVGGAGLIIQEATAVSPEGRITPYDLGLWKDEQTEKLKTIVSFVHTQGSLIGIQLAHAGRKASHGLPWKGGKQLNLQESGWQAVAPSAISFSDGTKAPEALTDDGIKKVIDDFKKAAVRAVDVGYDVLEIHAAHGYLIHEFLSPLTNQRNDSYGGSFENRIRLLLEILKGTQEIWPEHKPLFVRISASDWADGGWNIDESVKLSKILKQQGVDVIDCSSGGAVAHQKIALGPGYQVPFAERIKKEVDIITGAVGLITSVEQAEEILVSEKADLILIARESLRNPYFPLQAAKQLNGDIVWPDQYLRAK